MKNIGKKSIRATAKDRSVFSSTVEVRADTDGIFEIGVPLELEVAFGQMEDDKKLPISIRLIEDRKTHHYWLRGADLPAMERLLNSAALDHVSGTEEEELVIIYKARIAANFFEDESGQIWPNGQEHVGDWYDFKYKGVTYVSGNMCTETYDLGFGAEVHRKITTRRSSGVATVRYTQLIDLPDDSWGVKLNSFVGLRLEPKGEKVKEIPYTEERAEFFYHFLLGLCGAIRKLDMFLESDEKMLQSIDKGQRLLG